MAEIKFAIAVTVAAIALLMLAGWGLVNL